MKSASFPPLSRLGILVAILFLGALGLSTTALAATITVNSNADSGDVAVGDGTCGSAAPNTCTLRAAIQEANANPDASNEIVFAAGQTSTTAATAYPAITKPLTITGPTARFTLDGNSTIKAGLLRYTGTGGTYALTRINLTNGSTANVLGGGCLYFAAVGASTVTLTDVNLTACSTTAGPGGAVAIDAGSSGTTINLNRVVIGGAGAAANSASGSGGGLWVRILGTATVTLRNSSVLGNTSLTNGGGITVNRGRLTIVNSTISGNTATSAGGGIYLDTESPSGGNLRMENVTVSGNSAAAASGGGIAASADNPTASFITYSTIAGNTGGGIRGQANPNLTFPGTVFNPFTSNIVAANTTGNCAAAFTHADAANSGFNLADDATCGFTQSSDRVVAPADLFR